MEIHFDIYYEILAGSMQEMYKNQISNMYKKPTGSIMQLRFLSHVFLSNDVTMKNRILKSSD